MSEELKKLIDECEKTNAIILSFDLYNEIPLALVELDNGTPVNLSYCVDEKVWKYYEQQ